MAVLVKSLRETWGSLRLGPSVLISPKRNKWDKVLLSEPLAAGNGIYVAEWYETGEVVKLDRETLEVVWRVKTPPPGAGVGAGLNPREAWNDDLILAGSVDGRVGMIEADSGRLRWTVSLAYAPRIWNGRVVAKNKVAVLLIDGLTGETTAQLGVSWPGDNAFKLCEDRILSYPSEDVIGCLDLSTGQVVWQRGLLREMGEFARFDFKTNAIGLEAGSLPGSFVVTRGPVVFGLSLEDGSIRWGAPVAVAYYWPNVHGGRIYVLLMDHFVCLDEATGEIVYDVQHPQLAEAFLPKTGTIHAGKIAFAMESGHLAVFDLADGRLVWLYKHKVKLGRTGEADGRLLATSDDGHLLVFDEARH